MSKIRNTIINHYNLEIDFWRSPQWRNLNKSRPIYNGGRTYKGNESGFRPPLCTYRQNWARRTSWGWWDDWDDTILQTQDSKFDPWRSEAEHATSRSRRLPTILTFTRGRGRNMFVSFKPPRLGTEPRTLTWKAAVLTTTLGPPPPWTYNISIQIKGKKLTKIYVWRFQIEKTLWSSWFIQKYSSALKVKIVPLILKA